MKKILAMLLAISLVFAFVACGEEKSVEVNSLKPTDALKKYVVDVYTANGFSADATINYGDATETVKFSVIAPFDNSRMQYVYNGSVNNVAFVSEIVDGAKLNFFYHTDAEGNKVANWIDAKLIATNKDIKPYMLSKILVSDSAAFEEDSISMEFSGEGNMVFEGTALSSSMVMGYKDVYPVPEDGDKAAYDEEVKALKYVYTVENNELVSLTIDGTVNGKPFSVKAENFQAFEKGTALTVEGADSYAKDVTAAEIAEIKKQQEAEAKAAAEAAKAAEEAATKEAAAGSGAGTTDVE